MLSIYENKGRDDVNSLAQKKFLRNEYHISIRENEQGCDLHSESPNCQLMIRKEYSYKQAEIRHGMEGGKN